MVATDRLLPAIEAGDYIVVHDAGGYTYSMCASRPRASPPLRQRTVPYLAYSYSST